MWLAANQQEQCKQQQDLRCGLPRTDQAGNSSSKIRYVAYREPAGLEQAAARFPMLLAANRPNRNKHGLRCGLPRTGRSSTSSSRIYHVACGEPTRPEPPAARSTMWLAANRQDQRKQQHGSRWGVSLTDLVMEMRDSCLWGSPANALTVRPSK